MGTRTEAGVRRRARWLAFLLAIALSLGTATGAQAELVRVGLFGDSIAEGDHVLDPLHNAMPGQLRSALGRAGADIGNLGLVAAMPRRMTWSDGWQYLGFLFDPLAPYGASGYSAVTDDPNATATVETNADKVAVFYVQSETGGTFSVTIGDKTTTIDTKGPSSGSAHRWFDMPAGVRTVVVHGPTVGRLRFTGILERTEPKRGQNLVELSNLAHGARWAYQDFGPLQKQAIKALHLDLTILMYGGNEGLGIDRTGDKRIAGLYEGGLIARGQQARRDGGACLIIPPGRSGIRTATRHLLEHMAKKAARKAKCAYAQVLDDLEPVDQWNKPSPFSDGVHPTARGYALYAAAIAPPVLDAIDRREAAYAAKAKARRKKA